MNTLKLIISLVALLCATPSFSQYKSVQFDYEKSQFNDGEPLPAESYMMISGLVSQQVTMVELRFYGKNGNPDKAPRFIKIWKREFTNTTQKFEIPINYRVKSESLNDVYINYFRRATKEELKNAQAELFASLDAYIDQNLVLNKKKITVIQSAGGMVDDLNSIVVDATSYYRNPTEYKFKGFSDLVLDKINQIEKTRQNRFLGIKTSEAKNIELKTQDIDNLKIRIHSEVAALFNFELSVMADSKFMDDYPAEKIRSSITLNGGYGSILLEGNVDNTNFASAPFVGITLPLGNDAFNAKFWSNSSLMIGMYLKNFTDQQGYEIRGPFINRPLYFGMGYKLFQFIRISGGVTVLENSSGNASFRDVIDHTYLRPYVGISADLNLWLQFGK